MSSPLPLPLAVPTVAELIHARLKEGSTPSTRKDPFVLAVVAEDGGMRWPVVGGMVARLESHGIMADMVVGTSGGGMAAVYYASGEARGGVLTLHYLSRHGFAEHPHGPRFIDPKRALRRQPVMDMEGLVDTVFSRLAPLNYEALRHGVPTYVTATTRGGATVLQPLHGMPAAAQKLAIKNTGRLPVLAHDVQDNTVLWDGALSAGIPVFQAQALGATHVLVLRCKGADETDLKISPLETRLVRPLLAKKAPDMLNLLSRREALYRQTLAYLKTKPHTVQVVALPRVTIKLATDAEGPLFRHAVAGFLQLGRSLHLPQAPYPESWAPFLKKYLPQR